MLSTRRHANPRTGSFQILAALVSTRIHLINSLDEFAVVEADVACEFIVGETFVRLAPPQAPPWQGGRRTVGFSG